MDLREYSALSLSSHCSDFNTRKNNGVRSTARYFHRAIGKWILSPTYSRGVRVKTAEQSTALLRESARVRVVSPAVLPPLHPLFLRPPLIDGRAIYSQGGKDSRGTLKSGASPTRTLFIPSLRSTPFTRALLAKRRCVLAPPPLLPLTLAEYDMAREYPLSFLARRYAPTPIPALGAG